MIKLRSLPSCVLAGVFAFSAVAFAQQAAPNVRIIDRIDETNLVTLHGNTHPAANAKNDRGRVSDSLPMTDLILVLGRDPAQQAAFTAFVSSQYDQNSPNYHQWLTPEQVGENFGPSQTDIATISNWLTGHGFTVTQVTKDRMSIRFNGTAGEVTSAFHTEIHNLQVTHGGQVVNHIGNMSDPQIPAALAPVVVSVRNLANFFPRPMHRMGQTVGRDPKTGKWARPFPNAAAAAANSAAFGAASHRPLLNATPNASGVTPQFGVNGSSEGYSYLVEDVGPWDFATIYNLTPLWSNGIDGTGQTIAIAGTSDIDVGQTAGSESLNAGSGANGNNDINTFRTFFDLPTTNAANTPKRISGNSEPLTVCTDQTGDYPSPENPCELNDLIENSLDVEWSGAVAKNAQIVLVSSYPASETDDNLYDSASYIVNNLTARIMNVSYGECELFEGTGGNVEWNNLWQTAASEGIAVFVAAGDSGSASCDDGNPVAEYGLSVSGLASSPYDTAVGGSDFNWCSELTASGGASGTTVCSASPYWNTTTNSTTEASVSTSGPQGGYVPETPWNESCANPLALTWEQLILTALIDPSYGYSFPASDVSTTEQGCNFIVDFYGNEFQGLGYLYPYSTYLIEVVGGSGGPSNCVTNNTVNTTTSYTAGTVSSCAVSGVGSTGTTTDPDTGASQGSLPTYNNGWPKPSWQTGVTGIPSDGVRDIPDVSFFASDGYLSSSAYLICVSADTEGYGENSSGVYVAPCSYSTSAEPIAQEVGGTSVATPAMAGVMALINQHAGSDQGSPNTELYALAAKQTYSECSAETVNTSSSCYFNDIDAGLLTQPNTNAQPCDYGAAGYISPDCTANQSTLGYADNDDGVGILNGYSATTGYDLATGLGSMNINNVVTGWTASTGVATPTVTVTPASYSITSTTSLSVTVSVTGSAGTPTGTITLSGSGYTSAAETIGTSPCTSNTSCVFTIPGSTFTAGTQVTLTAKYNGDSNYATATGSNSPVITVMAPSLLTPTITVTPASQTLNSNASLNVTVSITGVGAAPTGSVYLTSGSYTSSSETIGTSPCTSNTSCVFTIPANTFSNGSVTITAHYGGDSNYASGTGANTTAITVTESTFTLTPGTPSSSSITPGQSATVAVTVNAVAGYTGSVSLSCAQTSTTATGSDGTTCSPSGSATLSSGTTSGQVTLTIYTTAPTAAALERPKLPGGGNKGWLGAGSGGVLAVFLFFGIPARRRSWRSMLCMLVAMVALGAMASCGGGSSSGGGGGGTPDPGTTAGVYTFTVTASATPSVTPTVTTTFTVTVN